MPTLNPRINVTLSVSLDSLVSRLAAHQRVSKSQVLREFLEEAEPALHRVVALMDAASQASQGARAGLARRLERDQEAAEDSLAVLVARLDRSTGDLVSQAEAVRGKRPARASGGTRSAHPEPAGVARKGGNPPASNRGVKSTNSRSTTPNRATKRGRS
jgi:hypothetical protein